MGKQNVAVDFLAVPCAMHRPTHTEASGTQTAAACAARGGLTERSIFHEPWWLDIATDGNWKLASVHDDQGRLLGEMPYSVTRKGIWQISTMPPLTRTLGPVIPASKDAANEDWRHRFSVMQSLIAQLPECALFHQRFDPRISDPLAFSLQGFEVGVTFTVKIAPGEAESEVWAGLRQNTRNLIRRAGEQLAVRQVPDADTFVDFYDANLKRRNRGNVYGSHIMRQLVGASMARGSGMVLGAHGANDELSSAIAVIWDASAMYYLLSSRTDDAHGGAISLLLWTALRSARDRNLTFDFDGIPHAGILKFLSGFGGTLVPRVEIERTRADYAALRTMLHLGRATSRSVLQRLRR